MESLFQIKKVKKVLLITAVLLVPVAGYILYRAYASGQRLIPLSVFALIAGTLFENKRITGKWSEVFQITVVAFIISFLVFLPGKREYVYDFAMHIRFWPYGFILLVIIATLASYRKKIIPKLTEGITLLQSIAVAYWVIYLDVLKTAGAFTGILLLTGLFFSVYALFHAVTPTSHSRNSRFVLSIWSSIIMVLLAIDYVFRVFNNGSIEDVSSLTDGLHIALEYFLLGVSSIYIARNILLLTDFLPGKGRAFNALYFKDIKALKNEHIDRYSPIQVKLSHSVFCLGFCLLFFFLNHYFRLLPGHVAIWIVFAGFPYLVAGMEYIRYRQARAEEQGGSHGAR